MKTFKLSVLALALAGVLVGCGFDDSPSAAKPVGPETTPSVLPGIPTGELAIKIASFRSQWSELYLGAPTTKSNTELSARIRALNSYVKDRLTKNPIDEKGAFYPINPTNPATTGSLLLKNYQLLLDMTRAYKLLGGEFYGDDDLKQTILTSLTLLNKHYYHHNNVIQHGNWWNWQIGIPKLANDILMLLDNEVDKVLVGKYISATRYFTPDPSQLTAIPGENPKDAVSANLADIAQVVLIRGILDANQNEITGALDAINKVVAVLPSDNAIVGDDRDGFYTDGSFIQHKDLPYTGSYGDVLIKSLGLMISAAKTSGFELAPEIQHIYSHLLNSYAPLLIDGRMMDFVNGRAISRESGQNHKIGHSIIKSMLLHVENAPEPEKSQIKSVIKTNIQNDLHTDFFSAPLGLVHSYQQAQVIVNDASIPVIPARTQHIQYSDMDRVVHHRPSWTFGIAMHSNRVGNYECINSENKQGWFTADGMTYLYNSQLDHYTNYWATVDNYRLPGTTVLDVDRINCSGQRSEQKDGRQTEILWAGGAQLNNFGTVGFQFVNHDNSLSAKKSWFLFNDEVVALGSDISASNSVTTIENRKLSAGSSLTVDGQPYHAGIDDATSLNLSVEGQTNPVRYIMLGGTSAYVEKTARTGKWSNVGTGSNDAITHEYVTAHIDHSNHNGYQYMIVPDSTNDYTENPIDVIQADSTAHVVEHLDLNITAANFWTPATVGNITAQDPMSIMLQNNSDNLSISVSDPMRTSSGELSFSITGINSTYSDQRVSINNSGLITVDVSGLNGQSHTFTLNTEGTF